ncbi:MAG TPA: hypothetical protein DCS93_07590 [Microscillaceae bacterium]|nr:hypothetical protein [Microscillaceae bacterium]
MPQRFSEKELNYLKDTDFLLTKHQINEQLMQLLEQARQSIKQQIDESDFTYPVGTDTQNGKISKGEQYRQLPYWVLDYPRKYAQDDIFAFRTMIWWGHEISCTLMLAEESWEQYQEAILQNLSVLIKEDWFVNVHTTPWEYHFEEDNYQKLTDFTSATLKESLTQRRFFKISRRLELSEIEHLPRFTIESFQDFMTLLTAQKH